LKKNMILAALAVLGLVGCAGSIGPSNWNIQNPVRYGFDGRTVGTVKLFPVLALGDNGGMLSVQVVPSTAAVPDASDIQAELVGAGGDVAPIRQPQPGILAQDLPEAYFAEWYYGPEKAGDVQSVVLTYDGQKETWAFSSATVLQP
jgi:hypothetical protein